MIGYLLEAVALVVLIGLGWRIWRAGAGAAAHAAAGFVLALPIAVVVGWASARVLACCSRNVFALLVVPVAMAVLTVAVVRWRWRQDAERRLAWSAALSRRPGAARATLVTVIAGCAAMALLLAAFAANLGVRRWPEAEGLVRERTLVAHHLLLGTPASAPATASTLERQRQLVGGLGRLFGSGRDAVADATGMGAAMEAIDVLREIGELDEARKRWLVRNHPSLSKLSDHPGLRAVASDVAVLDEVTRVANGSLAAAWRLGDRRDIQALVGDPELSAVLREIRLTHLRTAWRDRARLGEPVGMTWLVRIDGEADGHEQPEGLESFVCVASDAFQARGDLPADAVGCYRLLISGLAEPQVTFADQTCTMTSVAGGWQTELMVGAVGRDLALLVAGVVAGDGRVRLVLSRLPTEGSGRMR